MSCAAAGNATAHTQNVSKAIDLPGMRFASNGYPSKYLLLMASRASLAPTLASRCYKTFYGTRQIAHRGDNDVGAGHLKLASEPRDRMTCPDKADRLHACRNSGVNAQRRILNDDTVGGYLSE